MACERVPLHVLLALTDPQVAADAARMLRKQGITVDVAMNARIASAMCADSSYDIVVFEQKLRPEIGLPAKAASSGHPTMLEIIAPEALDSNGLVAQVRALAGGG
jgi:DNA-binding response OmpR family regulator